MLLSENDRSIVEAHIRAKMPKLRCNACGEKDWMIPGIVALPMSVEPTESGLAIPAVAIVCRNCGGMQFIHSLRIEAFVRDGMTAAKKA